MKLYKHQTEALERAKLGNLALFHECGTGKTLTVLHIISYWKDQYENDVNCKLTIDNCKLAEAPAANAEKGTGTTRLIAVTLPVPLFPP